MERIHKDLNTLKWGLPIALIIYGFWLFSIILGFSLPIRWDNPWIYLRILIQMHLFTGLFITAHDAMHGTVSRIKWINDGIGWICTLSYALFFYNRLFPKHHQHHQFVHTEKDPDYSHHSFFRWYFQFFFQYFSILQYLLLNGMFFFLQWVFKISQANLIVFWILPSILSSLQLFYFGTYLPHHGEINNAHQSRTQSKNHLWAFMTCYFFGYHYEHHDSPHIPWWRLYLQKS